MIDSIIVWSEVWALFIPVVFLAGKKTNSFYYLVPIRFYVWTALFLNICANIISSQKSLGINLPWHSNIIFYNIHSVVRLFLFMWFFWMLEPYFIRKSGFKIVVFFILLGALIFAIYEFYTENVISSYSYSIGSSLLLFFCIKYYLFSIKQSDSGLTHQPSFWIVTGLGLFVVVTFPIYLFYKVAHIQDPFIADNIWRVQNIAFLVMCIFLGIGLGKSSGYKLLQHD